MAVKFIKAHAYGNDFLFMRESEVSADEAADIARAVCERHTGIGADGLILFKSTPEGASMKLFNADGSKAEVSGNGIRCLAAILVGQVSERYSQKQTGLVSKPEPGEQTVIETDGGIKTLVLLDEAAPRYTFRAFMGEPEGVRRVDLNVLGESVRVIVLSVGNPQCIVLTDRLDETQFRRFAPELAVHEAFPDGTNVEFVKVERPDRIRVLIWERGVGPTTASGTGACASAVAAVAHGGAARSMDVVSPGGSQYVEWKDDGIYVTGWAEIVARGEW